jgi:alkyldihydroxyacetonephosphate synthase
VIRCD